jgi:Tfp pilus assembly protein PilN
VQRELAAIRAEREAIRAEVAELLWVRRVLDDVGGRLSTIDGLRRSATRWSGVIGEIAERLPPDAYLTAFRAQADTVRLEGLAYGVTGVHAALGASPRLVDVRFEEGAERRFQVEPGARDQFSLSARLAPGRGATEGTP